MTFTIDAVSFPPLSIVLLVGAAVFFLLTIIAGVVVYKTDRFAALLAIALPISVLLLCVSPVPFDLARGDQVDTIAAHINELPGVDSFAVVEKGKISSCSKLSSDSSTTVVNVITEGGESVDGHLVKVSNHEEGRCTYELKLPTE